MASGMATRCTACGTVFRVVPDQLRVSEGWVRCGRCSEVFNAAEALLDLDTGAPRAGLADTPRAPVKFGASRGAAGPASPPPALADFGLRPRRDSAAAAPSPSQPAEPERAAERSIERAPARDDEPMPTMDEAVSRFAADAADGPGTAETAAEPGLPLPDIKAEPREAGKTKGEAGREGKRKSSSKTAPTPSFLRQAEQAARWRQPRVRAALAATVVLGLAGLVAQVGLSYRDLVAARFPVLQPVLQAACEPLGCTVGPAHVIESLVVESSGLVRVEKSSVYRLSVALRNRAALAVALPALELSLTDGQGQLVARRVLSAKELGVNQATLGAGRELQLQATLQAATAPVAGYTIELFYP
jgi:predicted Zn finger-like uncharacterized protein